MCQTGAGGVNTMTVSEVVIESYYMKPFLVANTHPTTTPHAQPM